MKKAWIHIKVALFTLLAGAVPCSFAGEETGRKEIPGAESSPSLLDLYCTNASGRIADEEAARQERLLREIQSSIDEKLALMATKQRELQELQKKREQDLAAARQDVVDIYVKMDPEVAASQIVMLDLRVAVALLRKLPSRNASKILNAMDPAKAALLIGGMSATAAPGRGTGRS